MKVEKIDHLHAYAKDVDAVAELFSSLFGMKCKVFSFEQYGTRNCIATTPQGFIEFIQPTDPEKDPAKLIGDRPEGLLCISLKVPNMQEAIAEMEARGIKLLKLYELGPVKQAWFDPKNTFGIQIELGEYPGDNIHKAGAGQLPPAGTK